MTKIKNDKKAKPPMKMKTREALSGYSFLLPWIIGFLAFTLFPLIYSVYISFHSVTLSPGNNTYDFVGIRWYIEAFTEDTTFSISLFDTMKFIVLSTPMIVVFALILAFLLNGEFKGRAFFRAIFFFPVIVISGPVVGELLGTNAATIISPENFLVYDFILSLPAVLSAPLTYIFDNIVMLLWFSGVQIIFFLAGLQRIGRPIKEAASIDGASKWQMLWKIYLPFLKPLILLNAVYTIVLLSNFGSNEVNMEIYNKRMLSGKAFSYSAALSGVYFVLVFALLGVTFLIFRERKKSGRRKSS